MINPTDKVKSVMKCIGLAFAALTLLPTALSAKLVDCNPATAAELQKCINDNGPAYGSASTDTLMVRLVPGTTYSGQQIRINSKKNVWILGDTTVTEDLQPRILYQDRIHVYSDTDAVKRADTSSKNVYHMNNGTVWIHQSDNVRLMGLLVDGNYSTTSRTNTVGRIFAYGATLGNPRPVDIRGNTGVNILLSRNVQLRYVAVTNAWYGISIISPNLGGAFAYPDPNDPMSEVLATLPTSRAGLYGSHLIERCRIHDNVFGVKAERDWDLGSVIRNNLFWSNYLRHWGDARTPVNYIANLELLDKSKRNDGSARSLAYTTVGGAFLMHDMALTPYRIHNNTFHNNATIISSYYKSGTQHLFYNNLVGKPYQYFRTAVDLPVQSTDATYSSFGNGYTQTERNSEMLQYLSEHQRSNRVVAQDSAVKNTAVAPDYFGNNGGNLRLYNMRVIRTPTGGWVGARSWNNDNSTLDMEGMNWVPDLDAKGTIAQQADTGGIVHWIRHSFWAGAQPDKQDPYPSNWCPPWVPVNTKTNLADPEIFRDVSKYDVRWTLKLPLDTASSVTSKSFLSPVVGGKLGLKGWPTYEGSSASPLAIGAYTQAGAWAAPERRLVLRDTLIEAIQGGMIRFRMNMAGEGFSSSDIKSIKVKSAKFYNDVPVSDTLYNQKPVTGGVTVQRNSILSSKPWPTPYDFRAVDYNRAGYNLDDSLTKYKLRPDNVFLGEIGDPSKWLPNDSLYARAEVVLEATLNDGTIIYSNPGVFMFSRPRFQLNVTVTDINGRDLPLDGDGISRQVLAGQPLIVKISAKTSTQLPVDFAGYANLQIGNAGELHGPDGNWLQKRFGPSVWNTLHPNDTVKDYFAKNATVTDTIRAKYSPSIGSLVYRAIFQAEGGKLLPYFIQGNSPALRVLPNTIYQATVDTIIYEADTTTPDPTKKGLNSVRPKDDSSNVTELPRKPSSKAHVVINLRDMYGNAMVDSGKVARERGLMIRVSAPSGLLLFGADGASGGKADSLFTIPDDARIAFEGLFPTSSSGFFPLVTTIVDTSTDPTHKKAIYGNDTSWIKVSSGGVQVAWIEASSENQVYEVTSTVGRAMTYRIGVFLKDAISKTYNATIPLSLPANYIAYAPAAPGVALKSIDVVAGVSAPFVLRSLDSLRSTDSLTADVASELDAPGLLLSHLSYPKAVKALFTGECDRPSQIRVSFDSSLEFHDNAIVKDSIRAVFAGQRLQPSVAALASKELLSQDGKDLTIAWNATGAGTSDTNVVTLWNPLAGRYIPRSIPVLVDSTPPVLLSVKVYQFNYKNSAGTSVPRDSVVATFSAPIQTKFIPAGMLFPFEILRDGVTAPINKASLLLRDAAVVDSAKGLYAFVFDGQENQIVPNDTLILPTSGSVFVGGNGLPATNGCVTPGTSIVGRLFPKDAWIVDRDGDGNGDSVFIVLREPLAQYPDSIKVRWGTAAETFTVTSEMLQKWNVRVTDGSGAGDTLIGIPLPSAFGVAKGTFPASSLSWTHVRTAGPADTAYFNAGLVKVRIRDSIGPAVAHAELVYDQANSGFDTLDIGLSEAIQGIAKGDSASLGFLLKSGAFPDGSVLISVSGNQVRIAVPNTVTKPIVRGDSLRVKPGSQGGKVNDASVAKNAAGDLNPWVRIEADIRPPLKGWYLDTNGDGRVETALLRFVQNPRGECAQYAFHWPTMDSTRSPSLKAACVLDTATKDSLLWRVSFSPFTFGVTGSSVASKVALGEQLPTFGSTTYRFPMIDSVGPVLLDSSYLADNANTSLYPDTLRITPSEAVVAAQINSNTRARLIVQFRRGSKVVADSTVSILALNCPDASNCYLVVSSSSKYRPVPGDYVRLSVADSVFDATTSHNAPSKNNPFQIIHGTPRPPYLSAYYDRDHDGRIDSVAMAFTVTPALGTVIEVSDPSGLTDKVRQYVVTGKEGDVIGFGIDPWGENVTSVSPWTYARIIDKVTNDTAKFGLADSVPPVIVNPTIANSSVRDGSVPDTLRFKASELVNFDPSKGISFSYTPKGSDSSIVITMDVVKLTFDSLTGTWVVLVKPLGDNHPVDGDSIRFAPGKGITDLSGNGSGVEAKSTEVKEIRPRILPPIAEVETPIVTVDERPKGNPFEIVTANPGVGGSGKTKWVPVTPGGVSNPVDPTAGRAVISFSSNMPSVMQFYIYDQMGTFVHAFHLELTRAFLAKAQKNKLGETMIGVTWNGTSQTGATVADGIYMIRLVIQRELTGYEANQGARAGAIENHVVKVGIHH